LDSLWKAGEKKKKKSDGGRHNWKKKRVRIDKLLPPVFFWLILSIAIVEQAAEKR
jgi:hypothetical protein